MPEALRGVASDEGRCAGQWTPAGLAAERQREHMMPRVVLVPLDGSEEGEAALPSAVHLARDRQLDLVLLRVAPLPTNLVADGMGGMGMPILDESLLSAQRDDAIAYLDSVRERLTAERSLGRDDRS